MTWGDVLRAFAVVFVASMLQVVIVSTLVVGGGSPDLLLVVVVALGLLRGSSTGAVLGFVGGLVVDVAHARHARGHLARADARRLLGGQVRRDDRP